MEPLQVLVWILIAVLAIALLLVLALVKQLGRMRRELSALKSLKQSQATRHGQTIEQFAPLLPSWPWDAKGFRFLGTPIDGVQFNEDGIVFVEIKTGKSTLNTNQRRVRDQIAAGRISWKEVRL